LSLLIAALRYFIELSKVLEGTRVLGPEVSVDDAANRAGTRRVNSSNLFAVR